MYSESIRQEAMNEALQKGTAAITKKITLLQETETEKQNGFLMYLPVYNIGSLQNSDEARKKALKGFVYSPIRMNDFIAATIEKNHPLIQMEIYDGDDQDQSKNLLYRSPSFNLQFHEDKNETNGKYFLETEFKIFNNHIWHFHFKSTPAFEASISTQNSFIILIIGLILSFLITYIIYNFTKTRENALQLFLQKSQELRLTETTYRALHDYSPIGIIQLNSQFQIMSVNAAFELFIGYSENELKGMTLSTISHPDDIEISLKSANALFNGSNKISKIKKRFIHKNGKTVWSIVSSKIINYDHEKGPMFLSNVEDITESFNSEINLKKTQNQLIESELRYKNFFEFNKLAMIIFNPADGSIVEANKASEKLYGWNAEEFKKLKISDISQMEDPKVTITHSKKEDLPEPIHRVLKHRISSGELRDVEITSTPILMDNKTLIIMIIHDITERRKIENKLRLAESVFINSHGGILIADSQSRVIDVSPSFTKITGYSRSEIIGNTPKVLSSGKHPPEFYRDMWESLKKNDFWSGEVWNKRKNGEVYPENLSISAIRNSENQILHYLGFFSDITTSKLHESSLIEARQLAESATMAKSRFLATMSHEIRTPMNGILGMAQLLTMPEITDDERKQFAKTILNSGNVLLTLLNDILDLSKVEAGKVEIEKLETHPFDILLETKTLYEEIAKEKGISIECHWMGDKNQSFISDPHRIRQMLSNLVSNAIKFTPNGKIKIEAREIIEEDKPLKIEFSVTDTGIGIPQNKLSKLFEPFSQVESSTTRKYGGTGLGLSIVSGLSKLMGGNFGVSSQVNKGSRFWFSIAAEEVHSHKIHSSEISENNNSSLYSIKSNSQVINSENSEPFNLNLLIVDDDPVNRIVIENLALLKNLWVIFNKI